MAEERTLVGPVQVDMRCDYCRNGFMRPTGITLTMNPPLYPHRCPTCGEQKNYRERYPYITYRPLRGED